MYERTCTFDAFAVPALCVSESYIAPTIVEPHRSVTGAFLLPWLYLSVYERSYTAACAVCSVCACGNACSVATSAFVRLMIISYLYIVYHTHFCYF